MPAASLRERQRPYKIGMLPRAIAWCRVIDSRDKSGFYLYFWVIRRMFGNFNTKQIFYQIVSKVPWGPTTRSRSMIPQRDRAVARCTMPSKCDQGLKAPAVS
ncbi:MAG: hypothetical protein ACRCT1_06130 [Microcoleaceae cyanobacterium]